MKTYAIRLGQRYFCGFNKKGHVQTAWSLAGATLFLTDDKLESAWEKLRDKKKQPFVVEIGEL